MTGKLKILLSAQKNDDTLYTNWQITKLSNDFSEFYYKTVLLHDISSYLNQGVDKSDIIIFNSSININNQYTKYQNPELDLNLSNDIVKYYHLGSPVSLYPNKNITILYELFEAYREYYSIVNKYGLNLGNKKDDLTELFNISTTVSNTGFPFNFVDYFINRVEENNVLDTEKRQKCLIAISDRFNVQNGKLATLLLEKFDERNLNKKFNYIFNRFERPIVGIRIDKKRVRLLVHDFFVQSEFNYSNSRFLETNSIKQNSPLQMLLTMSFIILPSLFLIVREKIDLMLQQNANNELDQEIADLQSTKQEMERLAQQQNISLNQPSQIAELQHFVIQKGENTLDNMKISVSNDRRA